MSEFKSTKLSRLLTVGIGLTKASANLAIDAAKQKVQSYGLKDLSLKIKATKDIIQTTNFGR